MKSMRVMSTTKDGDIIRVVKEVEDDDGNITLNLHTFNDETVEWRMAELGLDDPMEAVQVILHEPFLENVKGLYDHDDIEKGRTEILAAVEETKTKLTSNAKRDTVTNALMGAIDDSFKSNDDPYESIISHSFIEPDTLRMKREHIDSMSNRQHEEQKMTRAEKIAESLKAVKKG